MIRFECKKCGSLVVTKKGTKTVKCDICGKIQPIPAVVIEDKRRNVVDDYDPEWNHYAKLLYRARTYRDIKILTETAEELDRLGEYEDSRQMAEFCRQRIAEEQIKRDAEAKVRAVDDQRKQKAGKIYHVKMAALNICVIAVAIIITVVSNSITKKPIYEKGLAYMAQGEYQSAINYFNRAGYYKDSEDLLKQCREAILDGQYNDALLIMESGHYFAARQKFEKIIGHKDSATMILECDYRQACAYMEAEQYQNAMERFYAIIGYKDAEALFETAKEKLQNGE